MSYLDDLVVFGRYAKCCAESPILPSSKDLAFFEYKGKGSYEATMSCKCGYYEVAHIPGETHTCTQYCGHCNDFQPHGPYEYDRYYCGHSGWD